LCSTLDYKICKIYRQNINAPNPTYYLGAGKVDEISEFLEEQENKNHEPLDFAILDCSLRANQIFNLENKFHVRVLDRSALILMIFLHHARTNEAKLQVEYAILNHQIPYVTEVVRRTKLGEHPGYLAGGEYKVDEYFRLTKQRIRKIQGNLKKIKTSREQRRKHRRRSGFQLMTLAGYTNAGKSALLQTLTRAPVLVDDRLFSTVSTKTRRFRASKLLFTDTVGFIRNLPTQLVEAFKSTLEEIIYADHIVLVVDVSENH
jgi:GTP-binding protein HflX